MANINLHDKNEVAAFAEALVNDCLSSLFNIRDTLEESPDEAQQLRAELVTIVTNKLIATE